MAGGIDVGAHECAEDRVETPTCMFLLVGCGSLPLVTSDAGDDASAPDADVDVAIPLDAPSDVTVVKDAKSDGMTDAAEAGCIGDAKATTDGYVDFDATGGDAALMRRRNVERRRVRIGRTMSTYRLTSDMRLTRRFGEMRGALENVEAVLTDLSKCLKP